MEDKYTVNKEILFEWFKLQLDDFEEVVNNNRNGFGHPYDDLPDEWLSIVNALYDYVREYAEKEHYAEDDFLMQDFFVAQGNANYVREDLE